MKKLFVGFSLLLSVLFFSSFYNLEGPGYIGGKYYVDDLSLVQDEATLMAYPVSEDGTFGKFGPIVGTICPGTGATCIIPLSPDKDGDPIWFVTLKRPGGPTFGN